MPKISELPSTNFPSLESEIPVSRDGESVKVTGTQLRNLMLFAANEISFKLGISVEQALTELANTKANSSDVTAQFNTLQTKVDEMVISIPLALATKVNIAGQSGLGFFESVLKPSVATGAVLKPPKSVSNFQMYGNTGNFELQAPDSTDGFAYTMQLYIWAAAGAGVMTATGFSASPKGAFIPTVPNLLTIRVVGTLKLLSIEAIT